MEVIITPDLHPMTNKSFERAEILSVLENLKEEQKNLKKLSEEDLEL